MTLAATTTLAGTGTITNIENIVINNTSFSNSSFTLDKVSGASKITVNNLQAAGADGSTVAAVASGSTVTAGSGHAGTFTVSGRDGVTALTVAAGSATTLNVGKVADTTAAASTWTITSDVAGTSASHNAINLEGSAAVEKDTAVISAKGYVDLVTNSDGTGTDQVEILNLSGNGVAANYTIGNGAPSTITISGGQNVTLEGVAAKFGGKTVTDASTATSTIKVKTTAAALDLTKVAVDNVNLAIDMAGNTVTVDGDALTVSTNQASLTLTSAVASKATNAVSITIDDDASATNTVALGAAAVTNIATTTINTVDNVSVANTASFGTDGVVKFTGAGDVTVGATGGTITAKQVDASGSAGVVTAFLGSTFTDVIGGSGKDVINVEGDTSFTIDGGAGLDTVKFGDSTTTALDISNNTTTSLSNVEVIQFVHDASGRTLTLDSSLLSGKAIVLKGTHASDVFAVSMDGTTADLSNINQGTNVSKVTINGSSIGAGSALSITGTAGVDEVTAGAQNDTISTGDGNDTIVDAGAGDDTISTGAGDDTVTQAGSGNDNIDLGAGTNTVTDAGDGNDTITGGSGNDTVTDAGSGNDSISLGNGTNIAYGNSGDDVITGGTGADTFTGGADKDTLNGLAGADILYGDNAGTKEARTVTVSGTQENETLTFTAFGKAVTASALSTNTADVNAGLLKTAIESALGSYVTVSAVSSGAFTVTSKIDGNLADFTVAQSSATQNNIAVGTATDGGLSAGGADTINAGTGADFVVGGEGKDTIDLGAADGYADVVAYTNVASTGGDFISSFESGVDVLKIAASVLANGTPTATMATITSTGTVGANDVFIKLSTAAAAGAVDTAAEVVTFLTNVGTGNIAANDSVIFAINDGTDTYLWSNVSTAGGAVVEGDLKLVAKLVGVTTIANGDLAFFA